MRVSHAYKFVFLAMPRTGSTTVSSLLNDYSSIKSIHITKTTDEFPFYHHISALELKQIFETKGWEWGEYKKFCVVRNPYDRVVSLYHHHLTMQPQNLKKSLILKIKDKFFLRSSFKDFVFGRLNPKDRLHTSLKSFICDEEGSFLVEDVLMFENLNNNILNYLDSIKVDLASREVPHLNASKNRRLYRGYYDNDTKNRVREIYSYEIERFGYSF